MPERLHFVAVGFERDAFAERPHAAGLADASVPGLATCLTRQF